MPGRNYTASGTGKYRFGFNGKEKDDEVNVDGGSIVFEERIYDSRLGRWLSTDPREKEYVWQSTYVYYRNSPTGIIDFKGGGGPYQPESTNETDSESSPEKNVPDKTLSSLNSPPTDLGYADIVQKMTQNQNSENTRPGKWDLLGEASFQFSKCW